VGLKGKAVVITGAAGSIGREVAAAFADAGRLRRRPRAQTAGAVVESLPASHRAEAPDVRQFHEHEPLLGRAREAFGRLDVLVNTAAVLVRRDDVDEVTEEDWDLQHDVNLKAAFILNRAAARVFRAQGLGGRIINFASQGWWSGGFGGSSLRDEGRSFDVARPRATREGRDHRTVAPGAVDTMMRGDLTGSSPGTGRADPVGHMAEPADMAGIGLPRVRSRGITGATINVRGWLMY
jgi:NAD(P)-dependent dehydrogenase (short-subunit alcohol dehydrogenase family)